MTFIHDDFLLQTGTARHLYHAYASDQPILDYHCHLPPGDIAGNRQFEDLAEIWLEGDHYKWRAMRTAGVEEKYCTGTTSGYEKFLAWARTVPHTLRNPLFHWTHLELKRYFGIDSLLNEKTAPTIWEIACQQLSEEQLSTHGILKKFNVRAVCTTDDPVDDLSQHHTIAQSELATHVFPTFRPDQALTVHTPHRFNEWVDRLATASDTHIAHFQDFLDALRQRHEAFHAVGCRLSDHGLEQCYANFCSDTEAAQIFDKVRAGTAACPTESRQFGSNLMLYFGHLDAERGWTKQLHLGPLRNNNSRLLETLGRDIGCDSIGDLPQAASLSAYLDRLDRENSLPKTILYNINPNDNYVFATMIGNFQSSQLPGKIQWGSGWWFLDQWEAMQWQMNALSNLGLLSQFVGMLTDSRSFMSYPRHEYFRRCLCDLLGSDVEQGVIPDEEDLLAPMIRNICYGNARDYLGLEI